MAHSKLKINQSKLRQPLFSAPPGSPECDPGVDLVRIKRDRRQYLPPYRYDKDEQLKNIYRTSDEAYSNLAKSLAYEYECCKHAYTEHQVILQNLTITQRKFFADAHMERAANIPARPKKGEPPINSVIRLVDIIYGKVFLEYFASKDGNLLQSQIENLNKTTEDFGTAGEHDEVRVAQSPLKVSVADQTNRSIGKHVSETPLATNTSAESRFEPKYNDKGQTKDDHGERQNMNTSQQSSYGEHGESSFDKLYYDISTKEESAIKSKDSGEVSASSESVTAQVSHSKLRQELLREIMQIIGLLRRETDKVQKKVLRQHLTNLRAKFNKYRGKEISDDSSRSSDEEGTLETKKIQALNSQRAVRTNDVIDYGNSGSGGEEKEKNRNTTERIQVLHSQQRVRTNDTIAGYRNMPREEVATKERKMVFEFEQCSSRSIPVKLTRRIPDLETGLLFIKIVAPVSLQEGYTFEAKYREWKFLAKVPKGGVQKGDLFVTPMLNPSGASKQVVVYECTLDSMEIPRGRWRDGFCSCFRDPLCLLSFSCPHVALSQVRSRMQFYKTGKVFSTYGTKFLLFFTMSVLSVNAWTVIALTLIVHRPPLWLILSCGVPLGLLDLFLLWRLLYMTVRTRREIKEKFQIPAKHGTGRCDSDSELEEKPRVGWGDAMIGTFCSCCSISQMGRHTADYKTYREQWLSTTGLPRHLETIVPKHTFTEMADADDSSMYTF